MQFALIIHITDAVMVKVMERRFELAQFLINEVRKAHPDLVQYHFQHWCESINFESKTVTLGRPNGSNIPVRLDVTLDPKSSMAICSSLQMLTSIASSQHYSPIVLHLAHER